MAAGIRSEQFIASAVARSDFVGGVGKQHRCSEMRTSVEAKDCTRSQ